MACGCQPKVLTNLEVRTVHDTTYLSRFRVDSVIQKDSIILREKGDTIYMERVSYRDRVRMLHDTTYLCRTDTLTREVVTTVEVERKLSWFQKAQIWAGRFLLLAMVGLVAYYILRLKNAKL